MSLPEALAVGGLLVLLAVWRAFRRASRSSPISLGLSHDPSAK